MAETRTLAQVHRAMMVRRIARRTILAVVIYGIGILYFFPVLYMFVSAFKTEFQAIYPSFNFTPTLQTLRNVLSNPSIIRALQNSVFQVVTGTLLCLLIGVPAAFQLVFGEFKKAKNRENLLVWFLVTIILPPVAILIPVYTWFQEFNIINTRGGLLVLYVGFNTPIVIWMVYSFFSDLPVEIMESAELDGCATWRKLWSIGIPLVKPGIIAAGLLVAVFIWNEFFLAFNLTGNRAATLPVYLARFREQQGLYVAQLSAASTVAVLPPVVFGWMTQKALVKGLTKGAVKG
ncbi:MAG: carbohydrate ABC transporter permease [Spirochaetaceae bacterium]